MSPPSLFETNEKHTPTEITNLPTTLNINTADIHGTRTFKTETRLTDRGMTTDRTDEILMTATTHLYTNTPIDNDMKTYNNMTEDITTATDIIHTPTEITNLPMLVLSFSVERLIAISCQQSVIRKSI